MLPAIELALNGADGAGSGGGHGEVRQLIFITDGSIGNEAQLFETVHRDLGRSRLFAVGIGSAPNGYFLERIAKFGRGTYTFIASPAEVEERMVALFEKLERPALRDVAVHWNDEVEMWPERVRVPRARRQVPGTGYEMPGRGLLRRLSRRLLLPGW